MNRRLFLSMAAGASSASLLKPAAGETAAIYLHDMKQCVPASALSSKAAHGRWHLVPYETEAFAGTMLVAGKNTAAPEITLPLRQKGWHAISLGLRSYGGGEDFTRLLARLKSDSTFSMITHTERQADRIDEYFWKNADLTGEDLVIRQFRLQTVPENADSPGNECNGAWLAYVKLTPLTEEQVRQLQEEKRNGSQRRLFAHHDAWSYTFTFRPTKAEDIRRELEPFRDTDFARIYWEAGMGDRMYYPTKLGLTPVDDWFDDPYRTGDRLAAETWRAWRQNGIDPFRTALEYAHQIGLEFHATYRRRASTSRFRRTSGTAAASTTSIPSCGAPTAKENARRACPMPTPRSGARRSSSCARSHSTP